jgi:hypothetical protein
MSGFFDSKIVQDEMLEVSKLQEKVYSKVFEFPKLDREEKLKHINDLEKLLEKQQILYMRMSLSDDSDAIEMKQRIKDSASLIGFPENVEMNAVFSNLSKLIVQLKQQLADEVG